VLRVLGFRTAVVADGDEADVYIQEAAKADYLTEGLYGESYPSHASMYSAPSAKGASGAMPSWSLWPEAFWAAWGFALPSFVHHNRPTLSLRSCQVPKADVLGRHMLADYQHRIS